VFHGLNISDMMKKIFALITVLLSLVSAAQVTVSVQLPAAGMIQKDQLWNLVLVNNNSELPETTVSLNLQDAVSGQTILSAGTRNFVLGKGVRMLNFRDIQPIQYNYVAAELSGNYIPPGSYIACYRIIKNSPKGAEPLADECVRVNISPLSPPLLNTPADKSILDISYPQFTWLPPSPSEMFSNLNYDIQVAEVLPGQSPAEAVLNNEPVYANGNIKNPFENYPSSFSSLQPGKLYAWQVTARNGLNYSAKTEVWAFSIKLPDSARAPVVSSSYIVLNQRNESSGISYINTEELLVKYYSFDNDHETSARFLSADGKLIRHVKQKIVYGDNFLRFRLNKEFRKGMVYIIEITDKQNRIYSTKFSIQ
jgi:hypothetical protein